MSPSDRSCLASSSPMMTCACGQRRRQRGRSARNGCQLHAGGGGKNERAVPGQAPRWRRKACSRESLWVERSHRAVGQQRRRAEGHAAGSEAARQEGKAQRAADCVTEKERSADGSGAVASVMHKQHRRADAAQRQRQAAGPGKRAYTWVRTPFFAKQVSDVYSGPFAHRHFLRRSRTRTVQRSLDAFYAHLPLPRTGREKDIRHGLLRIDAARRGRDGAFSQEGEQADRQDAGFGAAHCAQILCDDERGRGCLPHRHVPQV